MKSYREWLIYSPRKKSAFCFPCWLFANRSRKDYEPAFAEPEHGFKSWRKATESLCIHEQSKVHDDAVQIMIQTKHRLVSQSMRNNCALVKDKSSKIVKSSADFWMQHFSLQSKILLSVVIENHQLHSYTPVEGKSKTKATSLNL